MILFHDIDPANPYEVTGEKQTIEGNKITLEHIPLKGSVTIAGFSEDITGALKTPDTFHIDYRENTGYRAADGVVRFASGHNGEEVTVNYYGVGTMFRAKHVNELASMVANHDADENAHGFQAALSIAVATIVAQMRLDSADRLNGAETVASAIRAQTATINSHLTDIDNTLKDGINDLKTAIKDLGKIVKKNDPNDRLAEVKEAIHTLNDSVKKLELNVTVQCSCGGGGEEDDLGYDWDSGDISEANWGESHVDSGEIATAILPLSIGADGGEIIAVKSEYDSGDIQDDTGEPRDIADGGTIDNNEATEPSDMIDSGEITLS